MSLRTSVRRSLKHIYIRLGRPAEEKINKFRGISNKEEVNHSGTEYFDCVDSSRLDSLCSYTATSSTQPLAKTLSDIDSQFFEAYGPDYKLKIAANVAIDPAWYYQDLLTRIQKIPGLRFATCKDGLENPPVGNEIVCTIRHDVDGDLVAAVQQAKIEHRLGISTSFYLLHNAPYYGVLLQEGCIENKFETSFMRHDSSIEAYLEIQSLGHELALHTDGMDYYQRLNTDGAKVIQDEIAWLRKKGCIVEGTTAHNSFSVYGCNNYSIFKDRALGMSTPAGPKAVIHNGKWAPLQVLDEKELGLKYEANDYFWQDSTPLLYGCLMTQNNWYIAENQYGLLSPETKSQRKPLIGRYGSHDDMIDAITNLTGPAYVKLVVHPMHYGLRSHHTNEPWLPDAPIETKQSKAILWAGGGAKSEIRGAAINYLNEFKTADRGISNYKSGDFRIAVLGHKQSHTNRVCADSKFAQVTARMLRGPLKKPAAVAISASTNSAFSAEFAEKHLAQINNAATPDIVILEIGTTCNDEKELSQLIKQCSENYKLVIILAGNDKKRKDFEQKNIIQISADNAFAEYTGSGLIYWEDEDTWAPQAHFLVGKLLSTTIIDFFKN